LLRRKPAWKVALKTILFSQGDLVELAKKAEKEVEKVAA